MLSMPLQVTAIESASKAKTDSFIPKAPDIPTALPKRRYNNTSANCNSNYSIIIKPKIARSNSCSDLAINSELNLDFINSTSKFLSEERHKNIYGSAGDSALLYTSRDTNQPSMSWGGKKTKKKHGTENVGNTKFALEFAAFQREQRETNTNGAGIYTANSSVCSMDGDSKDTAGFPFKHTPSGNFKVQSNQVVFQSSTVGVLLADPTQAKVKVKFQGKSSEVDDEYPKLDLSSDMDNHMNYNQREVPTVHVKTADNRMKVSSRVREEQGKDLESLGYNAVGPIDWLRVQLPKKQDLFQELYRRLHNYINTDTVVHIGDEAFHCHRIVLQVYSAFFEMNCHREIEVPSSNVTPEAFQTIYEWMIFNGPESNKLLRRDNVLDLFCAAQYLSIKDLEDQCWSFIVDENLFTEDTAFTLFKQARAKEMTPVVDLMVPRVMRFFLPLVASKDFLELDDEEVKTFLKSNYICVTSEIEVLMAGVRWLYGNWPARRRYAVELMRCVRFGLISPWQLVDIKRNPDNAEILEIVNETEVQQMVDDGLAFVIIKYWYGNNSKNYYHWIDVLGLTEPAERNWIGEEKNHVTYKDFLKYLEQFMVPKEQMFQHMAVMQPPRRTDDMPGSLRGREADMGRPKFEFPLPSTLNNLTSSADRDKLFPTMNEFFENRRKQSPEQGSFGSQGRNQDPDLGRQMPPVDRRRSPEPRTTIKHELEHVKLQLQQLQVLRRKPNTNPYHTSNDTATERPSAMHEPPERDSSEELATNSETSTSGGSVEKLDSVFFSVPIPLNYYKIQQDTMHLVIELSHFAECFATLFQKYDRTEKRHSVAASYLAAATAALHGPRNAPQAATVPTGQRVAAAAADRVSDPRPDRPFESPPISLFNQSKESLAKFNMNKLSASIFGPSNKNYIAEGSLFNWDRETVLVFGGIDPHTPYGVGKNNGKDIFRFDPVTNVWDNVGDLPEPRHHHSVAFLRGRVYLVGGADPRDDDIRGKSVVVSTVWSYEPVSRSWYSENGLTTPRKNFGLVVHRMALYAIGGQDKKGRVLNSVERFDPKTGSWSEVRPMGMARMAVATAKYRDYIWVAGGMTGEKKKPVCKIVECYNSRTNEWTEIHNLRFPRCFATLFSMSDKLYIIGGAGKVSGKDKTASSVGAIDVWDWKDREWKLETEMSIPRHGHALAYLGTQLIIIGGVTTIYMRALNNVESFCCERGAWIRGVTPLPSPLSGHGAVTLPPASLM